MFLILLLFLFCSWYVGYIMLVRINSKFPTAFLLPSSFLTGTAIAIPIVYLLSCVFSLTGQPLLWGTLGTIFLCLLVSLRYKYPVKVGMSFLDVVVLFFVFGVSYWLMSKTFHGDVSGFIYIGSNNVFDFSHLVGLIRSFSFGSNIPLMSPFQSGLQYFYHFLFSFYCALWEYFGASLVWAVNGPSILSFSSLLLVIYSLPELFFGKGKQIGLIAILLTLTHPTMTFWRYIMEQGISVEMLKGLWNIVSYPFAGPFDGSTISIFMTLNNYTNQRHLAFAIAFGLVLYAALWKMMEQAKKIQWYIPTIFGCVVGGLFYWNTFMCAIVTFSICMLFILNKKIKNAIIFSICAAFIISVSIIPYISILVSSPSFSQAMTSGSSILNMVHWSIWSYMWENLSLLPFVGALGYIITKKGKRSFLSFIFLFVILIIFAAYHNQGFNQKLLSFSIIPINILAAIGIVWIWARKAVVAKIIAIVIFFVLTISGITDLLVVKNEFAFPLISKENISVISWINGNTPKNAVFVSYSDMIDPVAFAGRKNYFGFFGNVGWKDRSSEVKNIYAGDIYLANQLGISYILVPKWAKSDFPYVVDTKYFTEHRMMVYEDERYSIYSSMIK